VLVAENFFYRDDLRLARSLLDEGHHRALAPDVLAQRLAPGAAARQVLQHPLAAEAHYQGGPHLDAGVHHTAQIRLLCGDVQRVHGEIQDANGTHGGPPT
jgi:predicted dehydrogenase